MISSQHPLVIVGDTGSCIDKDASSHDRLADIMVTRKQLLTERQYASVEVRDSRG